jgi:hypothetical protein
LEIGYTDVQVAVKACVRTINLSSTLHMLSLEVSAHFRRPARFVIVAALSALALGGGSCGAPRTIGASGPGAPPPRPLTVPEVAALIPVHVKDRDAWSEAIVNALAANELSIDRPSACAVIAVIGQESGFQADPAVPGIAALAAARIDGYKAKLGPIGDPLFKRLLSGHAPDNARSFQDRLKSVRTERDVDLLFRDMLAYYEVNHPALFTAAQWAGKLADVDALADLNPITTAGPMQVSVRFAEAWGRAHKGTTATSSSVRDALYTRVGGVYYGTARLLTYPAMYDRPLFRFADYNAGLYSSRNAALQSQLAGLTGQRLALDGDLLVYDRNGNPDDREGESERAVQAFARRHAPELSPEQIRRDLSSEKTIALEGTDTYRAIKRIAPQQAGGVVAYATLPEVGITSPKFRGTRTSAWFARSVDRRYQTCLNAAGR